MIRRMIYYEVIYFWEEKCMDKGDSAYSRCETKGDDDYRTDTDAKPFREALTCEINSALLSSGNHSTDNIFIDPSYRNMEWMLRECHFEPVGISRNVPFNRYRANQIAFVYRYEDELYWCHMPEVCWISFLHEIGKPIEG